LITASSTAGSILSVLFSGQPSEIIEKIIEKIPDGVSVEELGEYLDKICEIQVEKKVFGRWCTYSKGLSKKT
jgi:hypothetical protein